MRTGVITDPGQAVDGHRIAIACCLIALVLSGLMAFLSDGAHHDDDLAHYLYAKWSANRPAYLR